MLLLVHPRELAPKTLYAIDQFVMRGGKLIAFMDPQSENDPQAAQMGTDGRHDGQRSSTLGPLLDAWGVRYDPGQMVGDRELGLTVALQARAAAFAAHRDHRLQSRQHEQQGRRDVRARHDQCR